jgi:hypothetical protein
MPWVPGDCDQARQLHLMKKTAESQYRRFKPASGFGAFQTSQ